MRTGIATVSLSGVLEDKLRAAAAAGFDTVELFDNDLVGSRLSPRDVARLCADLGLEIALFQPIRDVEGVVPAEFEAVLHRLRTKLAVMSELGTTTLLACSNATTTAVDDLDLTAAQLHRVGEVAAESGVTVAFEALAWGRHVNRVGQAWEAVVRADHPSVALAVDTFHMLARGDHGDALAGVPGERIGFLQVADAPLLDMNLLEWSRHHRCFPGQGTLDVIGVVAEVLRAGYRGPLSLEVFSDLVREVDPDLVARDAMRSLVFLEDQVARLVPELASDGVVAAAPTSAARIDSAFLEIAAGQDASVDDVLSVLGFARAGEHLSKPVTHWQHGDAHVVVNRSESGAPYVAALGLVAHPVASVARRASALGWPAVNTSRGSGEAMLPGITSPSGLHVFVSDVPGQPDHWARDFTGGAAPRDLNGLLGLDHLVVSVDATQLSEEIAFFRSVFGLEPEAPQEFMEPHGRLRSVALRPPDGDLRIVLNVTETADGTSRPHGVTQVALRSAEIASSIAALRGHGVALMAVPDNYYVDLDARFALPPSTLEHLREHQLLFDRDANGGELLHAFTAELSTGFHVELLERRGGYDGYGSANTFVRLAAQLGHDEGIPVPDAPQSVSVG